jgi:hypothetical protein
MKREPGRKVKKEELDSRVLKKARRDDVEEVVDKKGEGKANAKPTAKAKVLTKSNASDVIVVDDDTTDDEDDDVTMMLPSSSPVKIRNEIKQERTSPYKPYSSSFRQQPTTSMPIKMEIDEDTTDDEAEDVVPKNRSVRPSIPLKSSQRAKFITSSFQSQLMQDDTTDEED